jgi:hypothetical protein
LILPVINQFAPQNSSKPERFRVGTWASGSVIAATTHSAAILEKVSENQSPVTPTGPPDPPGLVQVKFRIDVVINTTSLNIDLKVEMD